MERKAQIILWWLLAIGCVAVAVAWPQIGIGFWPILFFVPCSPCCCACPCCTDGCPQSFSVFFSSATGRLSCLNGQTHVLTQNSAALNAWSNWNVSADTGCAFGESVDPCITGPFFSTSPEIRLVVDCSNSRLVFGVAYGAQVFGSDTDGFLVDTETLSAPIQCCNAVTFSATSGSNSFAAEVTPTCT